MDSARHKCVPQSVSLLTHQKLMVSSLLATCGVSIECSSICPQAQACGCMCYQAALQESHGQDTEIYL